IQSYLFKYLSNISSLVNCTSTSAVEFKDSLAALCVIGGLPQGLRTGGTVEITLGSSKKTAILTEYDQMSARATVWCAEEKTTETVSLNQIKLLTEVSFRADDLVVSPELLHNYGWFLLPSSQHPLWTQFPLHYSILKSCALRSLHHLLSNSKQCMQCY